MWYAGLVSSITGLWDSSAGLVTQGSTGSPHTAMGQMILAQGHERRVISAVLYCMVKIRRGALGAFLVDSHTGSYISIFS